MLIDRADERCQAAASSHYLLNTIYTRRRRPRARKPRPDGCLPPWVFVATMYLCHMPFGAHDCHYRGDSMRDGLRHFPANASLPATSQPPRCHGGASNARASNDVFTDL